MGHAVMECVSMPEQLFETLVDIRFGSGWLPGIRCLLQSNTQKGLEQAFGHGNVTMSRLLPFGQQQSKQCCNGSRVFQVEAAMAAHPRQQFLQCLVYTVVDKRLFDTQHIPLWLAIKFPMVHLLPADNEQNRGIYDIRPAIDGVRTAAPYQENEFKVIVVLVRDGFTYIFPELRDFDVLVWLGFILDVDVFM